MEGLAFNSWQPHATLFQILVGAVLSPMGNPGGTVTALENSRPPRPASGAPPLASRTTDAGAFAENPEVSEKGISNAFVGPAKAVVSAPTTIVASALSIKVDLFLCHANLQFN